MTNNLILTLAATLLLVNVVLSTSLMKPPHVYVQDYVSGLNKARNPNVLCFKASCANAGDSCALSSTTIPICVGDTYCSSTSTCVKAGAAGAKCDQSNDDDDCITGDCDSTLNVCVGSKTPGQACTDDYECVFMNSTGATFRSCTGSKCYGSGMNSACTVTDDQCLPPYVCSTNQTCMASGAAGSSCYTNDQCAYNLYCNSGSCASQSLDGATCTNSGNSVCGPTSDCTPTDSTGNNYKCTAIFTQQANSYCSGDAHCGEGLKCNNSDTLTIGMCFPGVKSSSLKSCDVDSDCQAGESCNCNVNSGNGQCMSDGYNPSGIRSDVTSLYNCMTTNKCLYSNGMVDYACANSNCQSQYCAYLQDGLDSFYGPSGSSIPACFRSDVINSFSRAIPYGTNCKLSISGASTVVASFSLIVFIALAILL